MEWTRIGRGSINRRLARWMMLTTGGSLLLACGFFVVYDTLQSRDALVEMSSRLRSPLVLQGIDDYLAGKRYDLALLVDTA